MWGSAASCSGGNLSGARPSAGAAAHVWAVPALRTGCPPPTLAPLSLIPPSPQFVETTYASDAAVAGSAPLQAWVALMLSPTGANLKRINPANAITTRKQLVEFLGSIVTSRCACGTSLRGGASGQHALHLGAPSAPCMARGCATRSRE